MSKPSQLDRAIADLDARIAVADSERERSIVTWDTKLVALMDCRDVLLATKQATAKLKGASKRTPKADGQPTV